MMHTACHSKPHQKTLAGLLVTSSATISAHVFVYQSCSKSYVGIAVVLSMLTMWVSGMVAMIDGARHLPAESLDRISACSLISIICGLLPVLIFEEKRPEQFWITYITLVAQLGAAYAILSERDDDDKLIPESLLERGEAPRNEKAALVDNMEENQ